MIVLEKRMLFAIYILMIVELHVILTLKQSPVPDYEIASKTQQTFITPEKENLKISEKSESSNAYTNHKELALILSIEQSTYTNLLTNVAIESNMVNSSIE